MTKESERDISKALAAFGAPRLKYHSFSRAAIAQPDPEPEAPASQTETPIPPAPLPFHPLQESVTSQPHMVPPAPAAPVMSEESESVLAFQTPPPPAPMMELPVAHAIPPPSAVPIAQNFAPSPFQAPRPAQTHRNNDTAMTDIFSFLSMKVPPRHDG
jgi:hypothetical protein